MPKYRSKFEAAIAKTIPKAQYEAVKIDFVQPARNRTYTPDFILSNGIYLETKGVLSLDDRQKALWVREEHPELDIRFVFQRAANKITKGSKTTYAMWAEKNGFKWADRVVPADWLAEKAG